MRKHAFLSILFIAVLTLTSTAVQAGGDPVPNDIFANALPLVVENGNADHTTSNSGATEEPGEPDHAGNTGGRSVWFKFTPTTTTVYRINTMDTAVDTLLAVYTGSTVNGLTPVVFNDDCKSACFSSTVDLMVTAGTTYYVAVDGYNDNGTIAQGTFRIVILDSVSPFQDDVASNYNLGSIHRNSIGGTNYNATRQAGELEHINPSYPGSKSVWYRWTPTGSYSAFVELTENFDSQIMVYRSNTAQPTFAQLTRVAWNIDSNGDSYSRYSTKFFAEDGFIYFFVVAGHSVNPQSTDSGNFQLRYGPSPLQYSMDIDPQDRRASIALYRPSDGNWYTRVGLGSSAAGASKWGISGDLPLSADFTGDGTSERVVVRNEGGSKVWYIRTTPAPTIITWGLASDKVAVGDFDWDGRADLAVIRNSAQGYVWYVRRSSDGALRTFNFGTTGDRPVFGDFDGDGATEVAVVRNTQSGLVWYLLHSAGTSSAASYGHWSARQFGTGADIPTAEDFDGDGKTDIAVFRPSTGTWYILQSSNGQVRIDAFGINGDRPQPADYNGDGKADLCVFRPSDGTWYIARPTGIPGQNFDAVQWGIPTDIPVSSLSTLSQQ